MKRRSIQETRMMTAWVESDRSTCSRLHVGAVIADHRGVILSSGYNGAPVGMPHCNHEFDQPCKLSSHAETNTFAWAARRGISVEGAHLYVTHEPCYDCAKLIIQCGITVVYYGSPYVRNSGLELLRQANIETFLLTVGPYAPVTID